MKNNFKIIIAFVIGLIISGITVYAIDASEITYNNTTVDQALDTLYNSLDSVQSEEKLYLYWKGNTFDSTTGGWGSTITSNTWAPDNSSGITKKNAVFNTQDGYIDLSIDSTFQYVEANTLNKIDCTDYNYISILYNLSNNYFSEVHVESTLNPIYYSDAPSRIFSSGFLTSSGNIISYPINCSEPGYISINTLRGISSDPITNLRVYGVYLSKIDN